jgi:hypothetical protein
MIKLKLINPDEVFERISSGKPYGKNLKPYTQIEIESSIRSFIEDEQYEKCGVLNSFLKERFNHELNYIK